MLEPPILSFAIERHGGTVLGSVYADLQHWSVNLDTKEAILQAGKSKRLLGQKAKPLNVEPLADALVKDLLERTSEHLRWDTPSRVRVLVNEIIPATNKQTAAKGIGRSERPRSERSAVD